MTPPTVAWLPLLPVLLLSGTAVLVLLADLWMEGPDREGLGWIGIVGLAATAVTSALLWNSAPQIAFADGFALDRYALFFNVVFCLTAGLTVLLSMDYLPGTAIRAGEYYGLVLFATTGMLLMAAAADLIVIFLGLEVMSVAVYVLAGMRRDDLRSSEAAIKYFLLGAFASGFLIFGVALLYGAFGTTALGPMLGRAGSLASEQRMLAITGVALLLVGFGFKVAAVPFHAWAPDVYEGAPTTVTAFMAAGVKAAAFAAFVRVFLHAFGGFAADWTGALWVLAALTMTVGNVVAVSQRNIKRMLAYSSIAHAGYLLVGMVAANEAGGAAVLYYLLVYAITNLGAFAVVIAVGRTGAPNEDLHDYAGIGFKHPFLAASMGVFMLSLAGVPSLAGFTGKFFLFSAAIRAGYIWLAVIGVLNSVVSMYYYIGVLVKMYMVDGTTEVAPITRRPHVFATLLIASTATVWLGLFPGWALDLARSAFRALG